MFEFDVGQVGPLQPERLRVLKGGPALDNLHAALLGQTHQAIGQSVYDPVLEVAHFAEIDVRLAEGHTELIRMPGIVKQLAEVKERLGWDAAAMETYPSQPWVLFDYHHVQPQVGGTKGRSIAPGATADDGDTHFLGHLSHNH